MTYEIFSILDTAIGAFNQPFFSRSRGEAIRSFQDACDDDKSQFSRHAADYVLYHLGTYDDANGQFKPTLEPERVVSALEVITKQK